MTPEERWRVALADEEREPSDWTPDMDRLRQRIAAHLAAQGCALPELAALVIAAHSRARATVR